MLTCSKRQDFILQESRQGLGAVGRCRDVGPRPHPHTRSWIPETTAETCGSAKISRSLSQRLSRSMLSSRRTASRFTNSTYANTQKTFNQPVPHIHAISSWHSSTCRTYSLIHSLATKYTRLQTVGVAAGKLVNGKWKMQFAGILPMIDPPRKVDTFVLHPDPGPIKQNLDHMRPQTQVTSSLVHIIPSPLSRRPIGHKGRDRGAC